MSMQLANALALAKEKPKNRGALLALIPPLEYKDGRTKQSFCDECDINLIMDRAAQGGTISHLQKYEGVYADFSDFDFREHTQKLTQGREVFDALPAEIRREFGQSPQGFFDYVNDPENLANLREKLPGLAKPGSQLPKTTPPNADEETALAVASEPASVTPPVTPPATPETPPTAIPAPVAE